QWWKTKGADSISSTGSALNSGAQPPGSAPARAREVSPIRPLPQADPARLRAQYGVTEPAPLLPNGASHEHETTGPMTLPPSAEAAAPAKPAVPSPRTGLMAPRANGAAAAASAHSASGQGSSFS